MAETLEQHCKLRQNRKTLKVRGGKYHNNNFCGRRCTNLQISVIRTNSMWCVFASTHLSQRRHKMWTWGELRTYCLLLKSADVVIKTRAGDTQQRTLPGFELGRMRPLLFFFISYYLGKGFQLESGDSEWQCDVNALCTKEKAEAAATMSRNIWKMFLEAFNWILSFFHTAIFPPQWSKKRFFIPYTNRKYELKQVQGYCMYPFFWTRPF